MTAKAWLIRAGKAGEREQWALKNGVSGGGFFEVADLTGASSREAVAAAVSTGFPGAADGKVQNFTAQLWALRERIATGDLVVMPLKNTPQLAIGRVTGPYEYRDDPDPALRHVRPVEWLVTDVPRTAVKQDLLYTLGAFLTICEVRRHDGAYRVEKLAQTGADPGARTAAPAAKPATAGAAPGESDLDEPADGPIDIEQHASDRLSSYVIETFAGYKMQRLVAAVLTAEGFTCTVPGEGADQGVDVLAAKGALGLDEPRLVVQVKSEAAPVGSQVVQQLLGAMNTHQAQQGLLVAWGGVTKAAEKLLGPQYFKVRVWSSKDLLEGIFRNYERLPEELRSELPLKRVWALVEEPG